MGANPSSFIVFFSILLPMVDIGLLVDDIHILIDEVIVNPIQVDLVPQTALSHGVVMIETV
jgi:hypothetical protein